ncbi:hypothetical protein HZB03_03845 [Candidatus Woesearchaeota archaeon]|nr:hypothetical protein [Candidatus Woesearchaeota archaeon]
MSRLVLAVVFLLSLMLVACQSPNTGTQEPAQIVKVYFEAWNAKQYEKMYTLVSDGFKSLEPTAATLEKFSSYAASQGISGVRIISADQTYNDGKTATVDYTVEFTINEKKAPFKGAYTLKYKPNDSTPGWKLVHPYGKNIDVS